MQVIHEKLRLKKEPYLQISSDLITSQADVEDSELCFLGRQQCNYLVNYHKSIMRQNFRIDGSLGSMDEDLEIKEKFRKRTALRAQDFPGHELGRSL